MFFDMTVLTQNTDNSQNTGQAIKMTIMAEVHGIIGHGTV
jgi:hypothetical protein